VIATLVVLAVVVLALVLRVAWGLWFDTRPDPLSDGWRGERLRGRRDE
jgi:hypothetical protein